MQNFRVVYWRERRRVREASMNLLNRIESAEKLNCAAADMETQAKPQKKALNVNGWRGGLLWGVVSLIRGRGFNPNTEICFKIIFLMKKPNGWCEAVDDVKRFFTFFLSCSGFLLPHFAKLSACSFDCVQCSLDMSSEWGPHTSRKCPDRNRREELFSAYRWFLVEFD